MLNQKQFIVFLMYYVESMNFMIVMLHMLFALLFHCCLVLTVLYTNIFLVKAKFPVCSCTYGPSAKQNYFSYWFSSRMTSYYDVKLGACHLHFILHDYSNI